MNLPLLLEDMDGGVGHGQSKPEKSFMPHANNVVTIQKKNDCVVEGA